jgi:hypothetical protein
VYPLCYIVTIHYAVAGLVHLRTPLRNYSQSATIHSVGVTIALPIYIRHSVGV